MKQPFIKKNRTFTTLRKYAWIYTLLVAFGGLWFPKLGLTVPFVILGLMISSLFNGRYWCGNICAHGSLFDALLLRYSKNKPFPKIVKNPYFMSLLFVFFAFNITRRLTAIQNHWGDSSFWDQLGMIFVGTYLVVTIVGSLLAVFFAPRTWCTFCPMGTIQKIMNFVGQKTGLNKRTNKVLTPEADKCKACGLCSKACPAQLTPHEAFKDGKQFTHPACIKCSTCVYTCPTKILSYDTVQQDDTQEIPAPQIDIGIIEEDERKAS